MTKRITAIIAAALLVAAMTFSAFADSDTSELDFDKKSVLDAWFIYNWEEHGGYRDYENCVGVSVPISQNPLAALTYTRLDKTIDFIIQQDFFNTNFDIKSLDTNNSSEIRQLDKTFFKYYDSSDIGINLFDNYGIDGYDEGEWIIFTDNEKYKRVKFIDNGDSFTMVTADETEEIGTYKKVYGFDDTDEDVGGGTGGSGGAAGGGSGSGANGKTGSTGVAGDSKNADSKVSASSSISTSTVNGTANNSSDNAEYDKPESYNTSVYAQENNPAVTPEIVSTVDALKDAANEKNSSNSEDIKIERSSVDSGNTIVNVIILIIVLAAIAGVVVFFLKREKKN